MLATIHAAAVLGIEGTLVTVEVSTAPGLPRWSIVGLADHVVREARERVLAALTHLGIRPPSVRVLISLAPADVPKLGNAFDLPIALAYLGAIGALPPAALRGVLALGELGLDGSLRPVRGILPAALLAQRTAGLRLLVPHANGDEARVVPGLPVITAHTLGALLASAGERGWPAATVAPSAAIGTDGDAVAPDDALDFADVVGQPAAKRALLIAAAGGHNVLMLGPPGTGKTMLARRLAGVLPPLSLDELLEVASVHSVAGTLGPTLLQSRRPPFRAPHVHVSAAGLVGGGDRQVRPGEVSLAHRGVLFLDELTELAPSTLEALRQPIEDRTVTIARAHATVVFPADVLWIAAMNPCPCGYLGHPQIACQCDANTLARYRRRISGPVLDRIDLHVPVAAVPTTALVDAGRQPPETPQLRTAVATARARQLARAGTLNARLTPRMLARGVPLTAEARRLLELAADRLQLSARAWHRAVRVARTIADLDGRDLVDGPAVAEALRYRPAPAGTTA